MNRIALWVVVTLLVIGGAWMLGQKGTGQAPAGQESEVNPTPDEPIARPAGDFVLATVNGEPIYHTEFVLAVQGLRPAARSIVAKPAGRRVILEEMIKLKVLEQEARRKGLDKDPEVAAQLSSALDNLLAAVALERMVAESPGDSHAFYEAYSDQFRSTRVRQILLAYDGGLMPPKGDGPAMSADEAIAKAAEITRRIRAGEDFAALAAAESDDEQTAPRGGELGLVSPGQLGAGLDKELEKLAINEVSDPVKSAYGVHVFEVTGREVAPFDQVENALRQQGANLRAQIIANHITEKAEVIIENPEFFGEQVR